LFIVNERITVKHHLLALAFVAFWCALLSISWATSYYESSLARGHETTWLEEFFPVAICNEGWLFLAPAILFICHRFRFKRESWLSFVVLHFAAGFVFGALRGLIVGLLLNAVYGWHQKLFGVGLSALGGINYWTFLMVYNWYVYYRRYRKREVQASRLETELSRSRLEVLKMQLQPHFLFNTLNTVASLNYDDPKAANRVISRLGDLLRLSLDSKGRNEVTLQEEVDFVRRYLDIEKIRCGDRLEVVIDTPPDTLGAFVPNLLLQPIVENSVRHGVGRLTGKGLISLRTLRKEGDLLIEVFDNGPGPAEETSDSPAGAEGGRRRVGLANTTARLEMMYGHAARIDFESPQSGGFLVRLTIPFRRSPKTELLEEGRS